MKRVRTVAVIAALLIGAATLAVHVGAAQNAVPLTVHEWGTFTSIAAPEGQAMEWRPLGGPSDLPCFVRLLNPSSIKVAVNTNPLLMIRATVRMETPVLYFYADKPVTARVNVRFPQGLITEWFPQAVVPQPPSLVNLADGAGSITWSRVDVLPGSRPAFPQEPDPSHYYAARATDAAPVVVDGQAEKFLFYRGLASFPVPLRATASGDGRIAVENRGPYEMSRVILFENRGGKIGYRVIESLKDRVTIDPPALGAEFSALRRELETSLVAIGLFPREAAAMVETWRDSWFEAGTRLFYVLPQPAVDAILPLSIEPAPASVARAFVGRFEIITPAVEADVAMAIQAGDFRRLVTYGRFLEPIVARVLARSSSEPERFRIQEALRLITASRVPEAACR